MSRKDSSVEKTRVIGIFAHVDAGKTTTSEGILYHTGRIHKMGDIDDGNTQLDFMVQERERGITIMSAATTCDWHGHHINLIDTPGHIDFSAEVIRSIRVIDGAVILLCGVGGVEPQTETVWMHADSENLARIIFVNKLDRNGADFNRVMAEVQARLTPRAVPLQLPIGREDNFTGVVDLLTRQALIWRDGEEVPAIEPVPADMSVEVEQARARLLDAICETDDILLERHLEGAEPDMDALIAALRTATVEKRIVPVLCGSARNQIGLQPLLDAIVSYLPSPFDRAPVKADVPGNDEPVLIRSDAPEAPFCAAAFKIVTDPFVGHLTWVRVFAGGCSTGERVLNPRMRTQVNIQRIYRMHGGQRDLVDSMKVGDVVALVGVKSVLTGDTLCSPAHPVTLETFKFPEPVIMVALTPNSEEEREKLHGAVAHLCKEDPTLITRYDDETGEETLAGMGELHLEIAVDRLRTEFGIVANVSRPQVPCRETIRATAESTGLFKKQTGGHGHFAKIILRVEPLKRGSGVEFEDAPKSGAKGRRNKQKLPLDFVRAAEAGVRQTLEKGVLAGYQLTDIRVTLLDGAFHEVDSSDKDFEIAGSMAVRSAIGAARPVLLEPVMQLDVSIGQEFLGVVTADVGRRRGNIEAMNVRGAMRTLSGEVPLSEVRGYATDLRSMTQGRCAFTLAFRRYDFVPDNIAENIIKDRRAQGKIPIPRDTVTV